jgi:hypothetical protein
MEEEEEGPKLLIANLKHAKRKTKKPSHHLSVRLSSAARIF